MLQEIKELLHAIDFVPFKICTSDGKEFIIPTRDHAIVPAKLQRVVIFTDEGKEIHLSNLHLVSVEKILTVS